MEISKKKCFKKGSQEKKTQTVQKKGNADCNIQKTRRKV